MEHLDVVEEYDVLAIDRKKLQAIQNICKAFARSQSADSDQLVKTFHEETVFISYRFAQIF